MAGMPLVVLCVTVPGYHLIPAQTGTANHLVELKGAITLCLKSVVVAWAMLAMI